MTGAADEEMEIEATVDALDFLQKLNSGDWKLGADGRMHRVVPDAE